MGYWKPTPKRWRMIGDSILFAGTTITGYAIYQDNHLFTLISLILTVLGKAITNFATEENKE